MSSSDSFQDEANDIINHLTGPLFNRGASLSERSEQLQSNSIHYAVTFNPDPLKFFNRRRYNKYSHDQQTRMLTRIEQALRRDNPSIELVKLNFEIAPTLQQIHFHALYKMPEIFASTVENYFKKYDSDRILDNGNSWPTIRVEKVYDIPGWLKYIRKDECKKDN